MTTDPNPSTPDALGGLSAWLTGHLSRTGQSTDDVARAIGVGRETVRSWLSGRRPPEHGNDYAHLNTPARFGEWLRARIAESGCSVRDIADSTEGVSMGTIYNWIRGEHLPPPPTGEEPDRFDLVLSNPFLGLTLRERVQLDEVRRRLTGTSTQTPRSQEEWPARGLPADNRAFTGRSGELRRLDRLLRDHARGRAVVISALTGISGVGKTALAIHWARSRRVKASFPDGCLYLNLDGYADSPPVNPDTALTKLLLQLGATPRAIPDDRDAKAAFYQESLAGRRLLLVLDNAHDEPQVRPLLPVDPNCLAVVTSRNRLRGLAATNPETTFLPLDTLTDAEAASLLRTLLGRLVTRGAEDEDIEALTEMCGRLPLAIHIAAANYLTHHHSPSGISIGQYAATLAEDRLNRLEVDPGDPDTSVTVAIDRSYRHLSGIARRLYRSLGLYPGPEFTVRAGASLAGVGVREAETALAELAGANLVTEVSPDRYSMHDLLRDHAAGLATRAGESEAARLRLVGHLLYSACEGVRAVEPQRAELALPPADPAVATTSFESQSEALAWFETEAPALIATVEWCHSNGWDAWCWRLAWALVTYLDWMCRWRVWARVQELALASAERLGDPRWQGRSHRLLGRAYVHLKRFDEARAQFAAALETAERLDDQRERATVLKNLGFIEHRQGNHRRAAEVSLQSLSSYRRLGNRNGEADALNNVGWCLAQLGQYEHGAHYCLQALRLYRSLGNHDGAANAWDSLGYVNSSRGHHASATYCFHRALAYYARTEGRLWDAAETHRHLADNHREAGEPDAARKHYLLALEILERIEHRDAEAVRAALRGLEQSDAA